MKRSAGDSSIVAVLLTALAVLPSLYVLSVGPAAMLREMGVISQPDMMRIYFPLVWLSLHVPLVSQSLDWYCELWV